MGIKTVSFLMYMSLHKVDSGFKFMDFEFFKIYGNIPKGLGLVVDLWKSLTFAASCLFYGCKKISEKVEERWQKTNRSAQHLE